MAIKARKDPKVLKASRVLRDLKVRPELKA